MVRLREWLGANRIRSWRVSCYDAAVRVDEEIVMTVEGRKAVKARRGNERGGAVRLSAADQPVQAARGSEPRWAQLLRWFTQLARTGFPRRFPIVQFPNVALIVALAAGQSASVVDGATHTYLVSVSYLAMTVWAYEELVHGVNWFRHLLGLVFAIIMIMRVAHAVHT